MTAILSVFPDTNLFLQCKPLQDLNWSLLGHEGEIEVLITRPVQTELDALKAKGNNRQAARSRLAAALIAELLLAPEDGLVIKQRPTVRLRMARSMRPDPTAEDALNYDSRDDQLVGIALAFRKSSTDASALLLTYDHGPMFSAREVNLPFRKIPDEWLLPPELDETARKEEALKRELERYQKNEPQFKIDLLEANDQTVEVSVTKYKALDEEEIESLLLSAFSQHPEATDFGPSEPWEKIVQSNSLALALFGTEKETFTPASGEEIERYQQSYAKWKEACKDYLRDLHELLNQRLELPTLTACIANVGSRPATDALVELTVKGSIHIVRLRKHDDEVEEEDELTSDDAPSFPRPPSAPTGHRQRIRRSSGFESIVEAIGRSGSPSGASRYFPLTSLPILPLARDPNRFYWKGATQELPVTALALECEQWRHAREPEDFTVGLHFSANAGMHKGILTITVHASNLTNPAAHTFPLRVSITAISPIEVAKEQIACLSLPSRIPRLS